MALHINGCRQENRIANLYWGFGADNAADRDLHGNTARFERNGNAKLTWKEVFKIRECYSSGGISLAALAKKFNVSKKAILNIVHRKTWDERKQLSCDQHESAA